MKKEDAPRKERVTENDLLFDVGKTTGQQRKAMKESLQKLEEFGLDPSTTSVKAILKHSKESGKVEK